MTKFVSLSGEAQASGSFGPGKDPKKKEPTPESFLKRTAKAVVSKVIPKRKKMFSKKRKRNQKSYQVDVPRSISRRMTRKRGF